MTWIQAIFTALSTPLFYKLTILSALPLVFAGIGGVYSEITGVTNIALEGIMKLGAFIAAVFIFYTGNPWIGLIMGMIGGLVLAFLHAYVSIEWSANQIVSATALILIAQGIVGFLMKPIFGQEGQTDFLTKIPMVKIEPLKNVPFIGEIFGEISAFFYIAIGVILFSWFLLYKTPLGLRMRAVGENPLAADTLGVNVKGIRYFGVLMSGVLAALGGMYIAIGWTISRSNACRKRFYCFSCNDIRKLESCWYYVGCSSFWSCRCYEYTAANSYGTSIRN